MNEDIHRKVLLKEDMISKRHHQIQALGEDESMPSKDKLEAFCSVYQDDIKGRLKAMPKVHKAKKAKK
jgi:hypothetical protein